MVLNLRNGLRVLLINKKNYNSVQVALTLNVGAFYPVEKNVGVSHMLEHNVFYGTKKYTGKQLEDKLKTTGSKIEAFTNDCWTMFSCRTFEPNLKEILDVIFEIVYNHKINKNYFQSEKKIINQEIKKISANVMAKNALNALKVFYKGTFLSNQVNGIGNFSSIKKITLNELKQYSKKYYTPERSLLIICGKFSKIYFKKYLTKIFSNEEEKSPILFELNDIKFNPKKELVVSCVSTKHKSKLCAVEFLFGATNLFNADSAKFACLADMLAGNLNQNSIIKDVLREKLGIIYNCESGLDQTICFKNCGTMSIRFYTERNVVERSIVEVFKILKKFKSTFYEGYLNASKIALINDILIRQEGLSNCAERNIETFLTKEKEYDIKKEVKSLEKVTISDINNIVDCELNKRIVISINGMKLDDFKIKTEYQKCFKGNK